MHEVIRCPVCDEPASSAACVFTATPRTFAGKPFSIRLVRCRCTHVFLNPSPSWEELLDFYDDDYHCFTTSAAEAERIERWIEQRRRDGRFNHVPIVPEGRYLDIGCGTGDMVAAMARLGMEAEGVEPSRYAVEKATEAGLKVTHGQLHEAAYPAASFDAISMFHVLEHTPDPVGVLRECRRILKPAGEIVIGVPNFDALVFAIVGKHWIGLQDPTHVQHFCPESLRVAAERAGLAVDRIETESIPEHVEAELAKWLRLRFLVPQRLTLWTGALKGLSARIARKGEGTHRGDSVVAHLYASGHC